MTKTEQVQAAWVAAMKNKDTERKDTLSLLMAALKGKAKDKQAPLTLEEEDGVIMREIKQTREAIESAAGREDIVALNKSRLAVLEEFAPRFMSEEEIMTVIKEVLGTLGIDKPAPQDKGKIMKELMPRVKGKAEGAVVNKLVASLF
ncbi:MAG: GatB/YqeY domain-containing protein [Clostridia bacterium]|nr:GatB/YqeY domain-containing protein [Clostridia bacterium]